MAFETIHRPVREVQALEQVGRTSISRVWAWFLVSAFLISVFGVALFEPIAERLQGSATIDENLVVDPLGVFGEFGSAVMEVLGDSGERSLIVRNRSLMDAMNRFEEDLEKLSFLDRWLLPRAQWRLAAAVGLGNEQVYIGRDRWLFFRSDVDFVTGRGFLEPQVQAARRRGGESWLPAPEPDPLPALLDLRRQLRARQIHLIVVPTPVKPSVDPEHFSERAEGSLRALENPSFSRFLGRLSDAGFDVVDPAPLLLAAKRQSGEDQYLRTDTHWKPLAVDITAQILAKRIESLDLGASSEPGRYRRRAVVVEGLGDTAAMLELPTQQQWLALERLVTQMVLTRDGSVWRSERRAEILLLGDSFTNVFSETALGWGASAGLGEQLAFHLQQPVDKLAVNAGGALQVRQVLSRALAAGDDRLSGKKVVIYQFAARELAQGDWRVLDLGEPDAPNR